jgi:hypothetical protein
VHTLLYIDTAVLDNIIRITRITDRQIHTYSIYSTYLYDHKDYLGYSLYSTVINNTLEFKSLPTGIQHHFLGENHFCKKKDCRNRLCSREKTSFFVVKCFVILTVVATLLTGKKRLEYEEPLRNVPNRTHSQNRKHQKQANIKNKNEGSLYSSSSLVFLNKNITTTMTTTAEAVLARKLCISFFIDARSIVAEAKLHLDIHTYPSTLVEWKALLVAEASTIYL